MSKGKIIQVMGPVVDVAFEDDGLPHIKDALVVDNQGKKCVMEVAQHVGGNVVRCIMLASSDGLCHTESWEVDEDGWMACARIWKWSQQAPVFRFL